MAILSINGRDLDVALEPERSLLYVLREEVGLFGVKYGCGEGQCGACTVWLDGQPVHACQTKIAEAAGKEVLTIEGLGDRRELRALQRAFADQGAFQCGYCTPGMLTAAAALLAKDPRPSEAQIKAALESNLCRCGGYTRILRAVQRASELLRSDAPLEAFEAPAPSPALSARAVPWDLLGPEKPDYFEALGNGLIAVVPRPPPRGWPIQGGAWVHLSEQGAVTAGIGKVEIGQGTRTGLTLLVAEELGVRPELVRMVMGDTDFSPWDVGTFGSRSTPDAGEALRKAAAAMREALVEIVAQSWGTPPDCLAAENGRIRERSGQRWTMFAEVAKGQRRIVVVGGKPPVTPASAWKTAGQEHPNVRWLEIVTAAKSFPSDLRPPGMLHGKVLRPPAFGASLESVDASRASLPGVTVVHEDQFVAVAAPTLLLAHRALSMVSARWSFEPQPSETDLEQYLRTHPVEASGWESGVDHAVGDVERAMASAEVRLEQTYRTAYIAHLPIEPRVAIAQWEGERLTVWTGTQQPFSVREQLAEAFGISEEKVRVMMADAGTGFGGKHTGETAVEAARLARAAKKPVRVAWTREEELTWGYFRPAAVIDVRSGAMRDGSLVAWQFTNFNSGAAALMTPYAVPNQRIRYQPTASPLRQGPYRSLAAVANHFARESHMDELAHALGVDPLELRLRHLRDDRIAAVFRAAAERAGWAGRKSGGGLGMGIAGGTEKGGQVATCALVRVDGEKIRVLRLVTAFECGALVNPDGLRAQVEGAAVMGLGGALFETIHFERGRILNPHLADYRVPRFSDLPEIEAVLLDRRDLPPAGGGETPIVAIAPAIANAVFDATGQRLRSLPLNSARPGSTQRA